MSGLTAGGGSTRPRLCFHLALDPARLLRARQRIRDYLYEHGVESAAVEDTVLAVEEAMTNAVRHSAANEDLEVCLSFDGADLVAEVKDQGIGLDATSFDLSKRPDPLAPGGRGLYLIAHLMDELSLDSDGGLAVRAVKRDVLSAAEAPASDRPDLAVPDAQAHRNARQQALLEEIDEAFVALDWEYRFTIVNEAFQRMAGRDRAFLLGRIFWDVVPLVHDHAAGSALRDAMDLGQPAQLEYTAPGLDRWLELRVYPTASGISGYLRDIDERKRKELQRDELLEALRESEQRLQLAQEIAHLGSWELDLTHNRLTWSDEVYRIFGLRPEEFAATYEAFLERVHPDDRAAVDGAYSGSLRENRDSYEIEHRIVCADSGEIRLVQERCRHIRDASGRAIRSVGTVHDITERRQAEEELHESERRSGALVQLARIAESQLDPEKILAAVVGAVGEAFGCEACYVALREREGWRPTHVWNMPEGFAGQVFSAEQAPCAELAAREQRPVVVDDHSTGECADKAACEACDFRAALAVPLVVQGESTGCLILAYRSSTHAFTQPEIDFATGAAATVSSATENANLYEAQRRIATTLQENLVHPLPTINGLELACLSLPARRPELVGGDFHDVFKVADDRLVALIGDVMGKGVKAAGLTETVHSAVRALALVTASPAKILRHVNRLLLAEEYEQFVSALVLLLDPTTGRCRLASAGHPPPVVVSAGEAQLLEPRYGPPLGTFESLYAAREFDLAPGETLVLYTDGLTEACDNGELFGEQRLLDALRGAPDRHPQALVEHLQTTVLAYAGTLRDDLEMLALRRTKPSD